MYCCYDLKTISLLLFTSSSPMWLYDCPQGTYSSFIGTLAFKLAILGKKINSYSAQSSKLYVKYVMRCQCPLNKQMSEWVKSNSQGCQIKDKVEL